MHADIRNPGAPGTAETAGGPPADVLTGGLPAAPYAFQPRRALRDRIRAHPVCALVGAPGTGKTQLAAAYARERHGEGVPVAWIPAETPEQILGGLDALAAQLGLRADGESSAESARRVRRALERRREPYLVVFDNAVDPEVVRPWLPEAGGAQVVITATDRAFSRLGAVVEVEPFTPRESLVYLREAAGVTEDARALADELGGLPLALAHAAAVINARRLTCAGYLARLRATPVARLLPRSGSPAYPWGVAESVLLSLECLGGGEARALLEVLAVLSPAGVPRDLLRQLAEGDAEEVLARLEDAALLSYSLNGFWVLAHGLGQRVARDRARREGTLVDAMTAAAGALGIVRGLTRSGAEGERAVVAVLAEQSEELWAHVDGELGDDPRDAPDDLLKLAAEVLSLRSWVLFHLNGFADTARAIALGEAVVSDSARVLGAGHPGTLAARDNLAYAYQAAGYVDEAIELREGTLAHRERLMGETHPETLSARDTLASAYRAAGRLDAAVELAERTLAEQERLLGPDHADTLRTRSNLAHSYRAAGRSAHAVKLCERTLAARERVLGVDHPDTLRSRSNLAYAYGAAGRLGEAVRQSERVLADRKRVLGEDHPDTLRSGDYLAYAYKAAGMTAEAVRQCERTLAARERVLGLHHPDTLRSRNNLASAYGAAGRLEEAVLLHERTLADSEAVLDPDHPITAVARENLALARAALAEDAPVV
ncbi:tetratricopeptide repeat protein [Bailinhaonella thermotolerans]|nr:tetratricopeptide repeat protein [Bailinhaonella thermotolerans]